MHSICRDWISQYNRAQIPARPVGHNCGHMPVGGLQTSLNFHLPPLHLEGTLEGILDLEGVGEHPHSLLVPIKPFPRGRVWTDGFSNDSLVLGREPPPEG